MNPLFSTRTPEEWIAHEISILYDSVDVINACISQIKNENNIDAVMRNVRHLEVSLQREDIIADESDKTIFINAINTGKEYLI